jgi:hypothetical protein
MSRTVIVLLRLFSKLSCTNSVTVISNKERISYCPTRALENQLA